MGLNVVDLGGCYPGPRINFRQQFSLGRLALPGLTGRWKARLARSITEADLAGGDLGAARQQLAIATGAASGDEDEDMSTKFVAAKVVEASGRWTCLLYTSPSPRDGLLSRMPSSA